MVLERIKKYGPMIAVCLLCFWLGVFVDSELLHRNNNVHFDTTDCEGVSIDLPDIKTWLGMVALVPINRVMVQP